MRSDSVTVAGAAAVSVAVAVLHEARRWKIRSRRRFSASGTGSATVTETKQTDAPAAGLCAESGRCEPEALRTQQRSSHRNSIEGPAACCDPKHAAETAIRLRRAGPTPPGRHSRAVEQVHRVAPAGVVDSVEPHRAPPTPTAKAQ